MGLIVWFWCFRNVFFGLVVDVVCGWWVSWVGMILVVLVDSAWFVS